MEHKTKPEKEHYLIPTDAGDMLKVYDYIYEMEAYCVYLEEKMKQSDHLGDTNEKIDHIGEANEKVYTKENMIDFAIWRNITIFDLPYTPLGELKLWESLQQQNQQDL